MLQKSELDVYEQEIQTLFTKAFIENNLQAFLEFFDFFRSRFPIVSDDFKRSLLLKCIATSEQQPNSYASLLNARLNYFGITVPYDADLIRAHLSKAEKCIFKIYCETQFKIFTKTITLAELESNLSELRATCTEGKSAAAHLKAFKFHIDTNFEKVLEAAADSNWPSTKYFVGVAYYRLAEACEKSATDKALSQKQYQLALQYFQQFIKEYRFVAAYDTFHYIAAIAEKMNDPLSQCKWLAIGGYFETNPLLTQPNNAMTTLLNRFSTQTNGKELQAQFASAVFSSHLKTYGNEIVPLSIFLESFEKKLQAGFKEFSENSKKKKEESRAIITNFRRIVNEKKPGSHFHVYDFNKRFETFTKIVDYYSSIFPIDYIDKKKSADSLAEYNRPSKASEPRPNTFLFFYYLLALGSEPRNLTLAKQHFAHLSINGSGKILGLKYYFDKKYDDFFIVLAIEQFILLNNNDKAFETEFSRLINLTEFLKLLKKEIKSPFLHTLINYFKGLAYLKGYEGEAQVKKTDMIVYTNRSWVRPKVEINPKKALSHFLKAAASGIDKADYYAGEACYSLAKSDKKKASEHYANAKQYLLDYCFKSEMIMFPAVFYMLSQIYITEGDKYNAAIYLCIGKHFNEHQANTFYMETLPTGVLPNLTTTLVCVKKIYDELRDMAIDTDTSIPFINFYRAIQSELEKNHITSPATLSSLHKNHLLAESRSSSGSTSTSTPTPQSATMAAALNRH